MSGESSAAGQQERIYFDCDPSVEAPKDRLLCGHIAPARDALSESQRVGVGSATRRSRQWERSRCVLGKESVQVGPVAGKLAVKHCSRETSRAVRALPSAEREYVGRRSSVPGMRPRTSVSAEGSQA